MINSPLLEKGASWTGYAALIEMYELNTPLPSKLSAISAKHKKHESDSCRVFTPRHAPKNNLCGHLVFAIKYEGLQLGIIKELFDKTGGDEITLFIRNEPSGRYARRIWFLYEFLQDKKLDLKDLNRGNFVDLLDDKLQYPGPHRLSKRHRVRNNLPGVKDFCPLIWRTKKLENYIEQNLSAQVRQKISSVRPDILMRLAAFLLLEDSKASFAIEGETPPRSRAERWGRAIGAAGKNPLTKTEFVRLQKEVISDTRFIEMGYRKEGGFIGMHNRLTGEPMPDHIPARFEDLDPLIEGLTKTADLLKNSDYPPVLAASAIAFGFVFIHPFEDGNGRIHRYLMHHVLSEFGFTPQGVIFPVSSVILKHIFEYRSTLEAYSKPRLPCVKWRATDKGNVEVLNDTLNLYRFFDATMQAEFFYDCVYETINEALPEEVDYLQKYDQIKSFINNYLEIPDRMADLLIQFLSQNKGQLSNRAKSKEFSKLENREVHAIEKKYLEVFTEYLGSKRASESK